MEYSEKRIASPHAALGDIFKRAVMLGTAARHFGDGGKNRICASAALVLR
jgi:hypothetical protein